MKKKPLKQQALDVLNVNKGRWRKIESQTGLDYNWISKFAQGRISDPGVSKVEKLIEWSVKNGAHE